ncbi:helix-turn-helix transcriptional regulator [Sphingobium lignivorans]|uniref:Prophage regulatory protein n=1 Tax=Sphingobium lignivorans TaxID=2735886 RepID=A0ABR6NF68_9SPHN|nr:AlpA family phage regulatory protein [Sphingobium lignivorans]MBB5985918.1 prophage regulatory protein [Sphingobium lignivorans]
MQFWRLPRVMEETGISKSSIYRDMREGRFPRSYQYKDRPEDRFWRSDEVEAWKRHQLGLDEFDELVG